MSALRVKTGFHRLGLLIATPFVLVGAVTLIWGGYLWLKPINPKWDLIHPDGRTAILVYNDGLSRLEDKVDSWGGDKEALRELVRRAEREIASERDSGLFWLAVSMICAVVGALIYGSCRGIAWVAEGILSSRKEEKH